MSESGEVRHATRIAELPLAGGHPAIDLVNTVTPRLPVPEQDHLGTPGDLLTWARRTGIAEDEELAAVGAAWGTSPGSAARALSAVREIRGALETVLSWLLGLGPSVAETEQTLDFLARQWASAAGRATLALGGENGRAAHLRNGPVPALLVQDRVAMTGVDLLCDVDLSHLGMCDVEHGGCGWFFIDNSKNKTRRWCTMDDCGAQAKARRLTERRRHQRGAAASSPGGGGM
jgi:predicted RNA-binding Zn ribbon-like protein